MPQKTINTRVQLKNDTEANWNKAGPKDGSLGFVPLRGELIIYSADDTHAFSRLKVGDGTTNVVALPFIDAGTIGGQILQQVILPYSTRNDFPPSGEENKLYIDLDKQAVYCYNNGSNYTQLSHFKYTATTTTIPIIEEWDAGTMTTAEFNGNSLNITNGEAPTLTMGTLNVVTAINEVNE